MDGKALYEKYTRDMFAGSSEEYRRSAGYAKQARITNTGYFLHGLKIPTVKAAAKAVPKQERDAVLDGFFAEPTHSFESVLFAGCVAAAKDDYCKTRDRLKKIIPLFDSWAHVDCVVPLLRWTDADAVLSDFAYLKDSDGQYEVRTYIIYMMDCCLTADDRLQRTIETLRQMRFGQYYVDMAAAWLLCEALVKHYDAAVWVIEQKLFPKFVHNKAIQKSCESFRISDERKAYLRSLRIK